MATMFRWLKKKCHRPASPPFRRYYTTRNAWIQEDDNEYVTHTALPAPLPLNIDDVSAHHDDVSAHREDVSAHNDDVSAEHIYAAIDDVVVKSAVEELTDDITSLTLRIEKDFNDKQTPNTENADDNLSGTVIYIEEESSEHECDVDIDQTQYDCYVQVIQHGDKTTTTRTQDAPLSPRTRISREKCRAWLLQQDAHWAQSEEPVWSTNDDVITRRRHTKRCSRQVSMVARRQLLRRIEETWFDSCDDSSDFSDDSKSLHCSSCSSKQDVVIKSIKESPAEVASSGEDSSGFYDENQSLTKSLLSSDNVYSDCFSESKSPTSRENVKSAIGDISLFNMNTDKLVNYGNPSFNPKLGFGLNKWYRP